MRKPRAKAEARAARPDVIVTGITSMDAAVGRAMAPWRFASWVLALFAGLALLLAIVGLVSVFSLDVAHRQREFAIRLALGARSGEVMARVLRGTLARVTRFPLARTVPAQSPCHGESREPAPICNYVPEFVP